MAESITITDEDAIVIEEGSSLGVKWFRELPLGTKIAHKGRIWMKIRQNDSGWDQILSEDYEIFEIGNVFCLDWRGLAV